MPQTQSDFLQSFLTGQTQTNFKPSQPVKYEPTKLDRILAPLTFTERVSASFMKSILDESTFTENMQAWVDYGDIVREQFPELPKWQQAGLGFVASVVGDPLTFTGIGALTKAGKGAKLAGTAAKTAAGQVAKGERALMTFAGVPVLKGEPVFKVAEKVGKKIEGTKLYTVFNRGFVSPTGNAVLDEAQRDANDLAKDLLESQGIGWVWKYREAGNDFNKALKARGLKPKAFPAAHALVRRELERPGTITDPLVRETAQKLRTIQDDVYKTELDAALDINKYEGDVEYWAQIATPDFKEFLNRSLFSGMGGKKWDTRHASMLNRTLGDVKILPDHPAGSIEQYNAWAKSKGFDGEGFITDPFVTGAVRANRAARAIANKQFIDTALEKVPGIETFDLGAKYVQKSGRWVKAKDGISGNAAVNESLLGKPDRSGWVEKGVLHRIVNSDQVNRPALKAELKAILENTEGGFVSSARIDDLLEGIAKDGDLMRTLPTITKSGVKVHVMPREVAEELGKVNKAMNDGGLGHAILNAYDQSQGLWKAYTLAFPSYHFRNDVSNKILNWMAGVRDPRAYKGATMIQWAMIKNKSDLSKLAGSNMAEIPGIDDLTLFRAAQRHGVVGTGFAGSSDIPTDIGDILLSQSTRGKLLRSAKGNKFIAFNRGWAKLTEDNARLANFIDGVKVGLANGGKFDDVVREASLRVKKTLYDYENLTDFEKNVMRRIAPFYTWARRNIPAQFKNLLQHPGQAFGAAWMDKARRNIEGAEFGGPKGDIRGIAEWMMLQYPIRMYRDKNGVERIGTVGGFIPVGDLIKMTDPKNELYAMMTPFAKEPIAQMTNYDPFFRSVIEQYPGQASKFVGVNMSNRMKHVLRNIRILNEADRILDTLDPRTLGNLTFTEANARFLTGFRLYPQDPVKGMAYYEYELQRAISTRKSAIRKLQRQAAQGRIDAKLYQRELNRLLEQIAELEKRPQEIPK